MTPATSSEPETPSNTIVTPRIDRTTHVCKIAQRVTEIAKECFDQCGKPAREEDDQTMGCYYGCGLPKLGYEENQSGFNELMNQLRESPYWTGLKETYNEDKKTFGEDTDMRKTAEEFFDEKCVEDYLANGPGR